MAFQNKKFIVGERSPEWFKEQCSLGRAKVVYDDEGDFVNIIVYSATKNTFLSMAVFTMDVNRTGSAVAFGGSAPDNSSEVW